MRPVSITVVPVTLTVSGLAILPAIKYSRSPPLIGKKPLNCFSQAKVMVELVVADTVTLAAGSGEAER